VPVKTTAVFCKDCGMMVQLESSSSKIVCKFCHKVTDIREMIKSGDLETETTVTLSQRKDWMIEERTGESERPTVEQDCEKCDNNLMYYTTRQTRSVDEGQTVYYECTKCGHTFVEST
jgi:DNA-directed RNA polymerase subunit M/transcription elongation factor TFIIS